MKLVVCVIENGNGVRSGEVIDVLPEDHVFSPAEISHPRWRIVSADITQAEAEGLVAAPVVIPGEVGAGRRMRLDVVGLPDSLTRAELYARVVDP